MNSIWKCTGIVLACCMCLTVGVQTAAGDGDTYTAIISIRDASGAAVTDNYVSYIDQSGQAIDATVIGEGLYEITVSSPELVLHVASKQNAIADQSYELMLPPGVTNARVNVDTAELTVSLTSAVTPPVQPDLGTAGLSGGDAASGGCVLDCSGTDEGEACGSDTNGGCNSTPPIFSDAVCGETICGNAWAEGGTRDTDWYLLNHPGGILSGTLRSQFNGVNFIVDGIAACAPLVIGDIGTSNNCVNIDTAGNIVLPAGQFVVFVATADFEGTPCGGGNNDYEVSIFCGTTECGNGDCEPGEDQCNCPEDCGDPPANETSCSDGVDNDCDGATDCDDSDCAEDPACATGCPGAGDCCSPNGTTGCDDTCSGQDCAGCCESVCALDPFCCDVEWDSICADEACGPGGLCAAVEPGDCGDPAAGDCCSPNGTVACDNNCGGVACENPTCCEDVCAVDPFCCDTEWDGICADEACGAGGICAGPMECPDCPCPDGSLDEGEACGDDTNGGCNSTPPAFTQALCGDTFCGTAWAEGGTRDTDWYLINTGGGPISSTVVSSTQTTNFVVSGIPSCSPAVEGAIGCSNQCGPIADASADLPAGEYVIFVATGDCAGGGIFDGVPCGTACNDYSVTITCTPGAEPGACCLDDGSCVDGVDQEECEEEPGGGEPCTDCCQDGGNGSPGCEDPDCEAIVCGIDPFCCDISWDGICAGEAQDLCECCGVDEGGLGGEYAGDGTSCDDPGVCGPPTGACCQCDGAEQFCTIETEEDCAALGGLYLGDGASCESGGMGDVQVYESSPNVAIPDGSSMYVTDTISVGDSFEIQDLEVDLVINHTWVGDLCVTLSKDGQDPITLIQRMGDPALGCDGGCCGCSSNNMDIVLDDEGDGPIEEQCVDNLTGTWIPEQPLLPNFAGLSNGDWTIAVNDNASLDTGTLVHWSLHITQPAGDPVSPCEEAGHTCATEQTLIIKQGACPAPVNLNSNGVIPMALVGSEDFDVSTVDVDSLELSLCGEDGGIAPLNGPPGPSPQYVDVNHPYDGSIECDDDSCACNADQSSDGITDLWLKFSTNELADLIGEASGTIKLELTGSTTDGGFYARDCIAIMPSGSAAASSLSVGSNVLNTFVTVQPLDLNLDSDGFASFGRAYYEGTTVRLTAPDVSENRAFSYWKLDGQALTPGQNVIEVEVGADTTLEAVYQYNRKVIVPGNDDQDNQDDSL